MKSSHRLLWLFAGLVLGAVAFGGILGQPWAVRAGGNDRFEDYVICTGPVSVGVRAQTDGVWLLDYRSGKLLGTVVERSQGKVLGWAELDLVAEFGVAPRQNSVHFLMTTGQISPHQSALYVAETSTGKFGVYTMGPRDDGQPGMGIRRHDLVLFRQPVQAN